MAHRDDDGLVSPGNIGSKRPYAKPEIFDFLEEVTVFGSDDPGGGDDPGAG